MSELDRWARDHKHRVLREKIARIRASRGGFWSGTVASGAIGFSHLASGISQAQKSSLFGCGFMGISSGVAATPIMSSGCISDGSRLSESVSSGVLIRAPVNWEKIYGAIGAG